MWSKLFGRDLSSIDRKADDVAGSLAKAVQKETKINMKSNSRCVINGVEFSGRNVVITGNDVIIDGKRVEIPEQKHITIAVHGDCDRIDTTSGDVTVAGVAGSVGTMSGDVTVTQGGIDGSVKTMSGDVTANGNIGGGVSTMSGDIRHK